MHCHRCRRCGREKEFTMTRVLASDQVKTGADGLTKLVPASRQPEQADSTAADGAGRPMPFIPTEAEQSQQRMQQPLVDYVEQQAAATQRDRELVEKLGYGKMR